MLSYVTELLRYFTDAVVFDRLTESPPEEILIGTANTLRLLLVESPYPNALPAISMLLLASLRLDTIVVFAFCVVEKPMLRTTKAKAAATITNAIITIADSTPMTPRWDCLCPFLIRFIGFV